MANSEHLQILEKGVEAWNQWREQHRDVRPDLRRVDFGSADLTKTTLAKTILTRTILTEAELTEAYLSEAYLYETISGDTTLTAARSLETCHHWGPSVLDHRTLARSWPLPTVPSGLWSPGRAD